MHIREIKEKRKAESILQSAVDYWRYPWRLPIIQCNLLTTEMKRWCSDLLSCSCMSYMCSRFSVTGISFLTASCHAPHPCLSFCPLCHLSCKLCADVWPHLLAEEKPHKSKTIFFRFLPASSLLVPISNDCFSVRQATHLSALWRGFGGCSQRLF